MGAVIRFSGDGFQSYRMMLERFADNLADAEPLFDALADVVAEGNAQQFKRLGSHYGTPWKPLEPAYAAWKAKKYPGKPLMVRTGLLKESLTQRPMGIDEVHSRGMTVGTGVEYAKYHQRHDPKRPLLGTPSRSDQRKFSTALHNWVVKGEVR